MAVAADKVVVELEAKLAKYEANVARADQKFDRAMTSIQRSASKTEAFISRSMSTIGAALAGVSFTALARGLLDIADTAKKLDAQLKLATQSSGSFGQAQKDVARIAEDTRSGLEETAKLYSVFLRNARELNITQAQAARATQTVAESYKVSGASAAEAAQGQIQLVQALQSGVLRGDEFNSVMENSPRLARLLADSLGVTIGQLRAMAEAGKLTSDKLIRAFTDQKFTAGIDAEFKQMPVTFDQAMSQVENAAITTFGAFDRGGQFSTAISNFVTDGGKGFASLERAAEDFGSTVSAEIAGLINVFDRLIASIKETAEQFGILSAIRFVDGAAGQGRALEAANAAVNPIGNLIGILGARAREQKKRENTERLVNDRINKALDFDPKNPLGRPELPPLKPAGTTAKKKKKGPKGLSAEQIEERQTAALDRLGEEELRARAELATTAQERADIAKDLLLRERQSTLDRLKKQKALTPQAQALIDTIYGRPAKTDAQGNIVDEGRPGLLAQRINRDTDEELARQSDDMLRRQADTLDALESIETNAQARKKLGESALLIQQQIERNLLEQEIASGRVADAEKARAELASKQTAERVGFARDNASPLQKHADELRARGENTQDLVEGFVVDELQHVQDGISNALTKKLGVKDPLIASLINLFIEQTIMRPLAEALAAGSGGGGLGAIAAGIGSVFGFASGGTMRIGGRGGTDRNVLALNGKPIGKVSRGETLNIGSKTLGGPAGAGGNTQEIYVDARGAVMNDQFAQMILSQAKGYAAAAGQAAYASSVRDAPVLAAKRQRYGV